MIGIEPNTGPAVAYAHRSRQYDTGPDWVR